MATIRCPKASRWITQINNVCIERRDVTIFSDTCSHCDLCGLKNCEYFDNSPDATKSFLKEQALSHGTIRQKAQAEEYERILRQKHGQMIGTSKKKQRGERTAS